VGWPDQWEAAGEGLASGTEILGSRNSVAWLSSENRPITSGFQEAGVDRTAGLGEPWIQFNAMPVERYPAGLDVWPQLLVNFRRSAATDACSYLPSHVVSEYYGHSEAISYSNYRMTVATHAQACATAPSLIEDSIPKPSDEEAA
jgi:hypothetical protein